MRLSVSRGPLTRLAFARRPLPASGLGHAHILEAPSGDHSMELFETVFEGDRAGRLGGWISVPATPLGNDPSGPAQACVAMRIFLQRRCTLELGVEPSEHGNFIFTEGD